MGKIYKTIDSIRIQLVCISSPLSRQTESAQLVLVCNSCSFAFTTAHLPDINPSKDFFCW